MADAPAFPRKQTSVHVLLRRDVADIFLERKQGCRLLTFLGWHTRIRPPLPLARSLEMAAVCVNVPAPRALGLPARASQRRRRRCGVRCIGDDDLPELLKGLELNAKGDLVDTKTGEALNDFGATRFDLKVRALRAGAYIRPHPCST
jgi:hypothetical protein